VPLAALLLAAGAIGDRLGHRKIVITGFAGFGIASVLCGLAPGMPVLIAARAMQGISAALMLPGTLALLADTAPAEGARARVVGIWASVGGVALPAGPLVGGLLVQTASWRAVFWLGVPVIALALVPVVRLPGRAGHPGPEAAVDWAGAAFLVATLACLVAAVIQAPADPALAALMAGLTVLAGAALWQAERHAPPAAAARAGPCPPPAGGRVRRRRADELLRARLGVAVNLGHPAYPVLAGSLVVWGSGLGILTPAIVTAALRAVPGASGTASGASNTARQAGGALGVAMFSVAVADNSHRINRTVAPPRAVTAPFMMAVTRPGCQRLAPALLRVAGRWSGAGGAVRLGAKAVESELEGPAPAVVPGRALAHEVGVDREDAREVVGGEAGPERAAGLGVADELGTEGQRLVADRPQVGRVRVAAGEDVVEDRVRGLLLAHPLHEGGEPAPCRGLPGGAVDDRSQPAGRDVRDHRVEQSFPAAEAVVDGARAHAGAAGDVLQGNVKAAGGEGLRRGRHHFLYVAARVRAQGPFSGQSLSAAHAGNLIILTCHQLKVGSPPSR